MTDVRFAFRQLVKSPGFSTVAVLTLALGIGATTAIFSVVYAVVLRPLPFPDSERLVAVWTQTPQFDRLPMAAANHRDLKSQNTVFEDIAILSRVANYNLTGDGEPERLLAARVAANFFPLLRVKPALGRGFTEHENQPGRDRVVILSHGLWQRRYAGDPNIVGKTIRLENLPHAGVIAWTVRQRTREIGVRMALGAQRGAVLALVLQNGLKLASTGTAIGVIGALVLSQLLRGLLFGIGPTDPLTFAAVPLLLVSVALLACWLPARSAARVNPMEALRCE